MKQHADLASRDAAITFLTSIKTHDLASGKVLTSASAKPNKDCQVRCIIFCTKYYRGPA